MKTTILIFVIVMACLNSEAKTKIKPTWETIHCFIYKNDTIILEPLSLTPGTGLVSNLDEVGSEIYVDNDWDKTVAEFCKSKYIKMIPSDLCVERVGDTLYIIDLKLQSANKLLAEMKFKKLCYAI